MRAAVTRRCSVAGWERLTRVEILPCWDPLIAPFLALETTNGLWDQCATDRFPLLFRFRLEPVRCPRQQIELEYGPHPCPCTRPLLYVVEACVLKNGSLYDSNQIFPESSVQSKSEQKSVFTILKRPVQRPEIGSSLHKHNTHRRFLFTAGGTTSPAGGGATAVSHTAAVDL